MNFECHITIAHEDREAALAVYRAAPGIFNGWKTSSIDGDPLLGEEVFFYITGHSDNYISLHRRMEQITSELYRSGVFPIRQKIELIMLDVRF